jgi:hypothetical protein
VRPSFALLTLTICASSCAAPRRYAGIDLRPNAAPIELQVLARSAQGGDKQAALELGIAYEEGNVVAANLRQARKLYAQAAASSGGKLWVWSPTVGTIRGQIIPIELGPASLGLNEAKLRLARMPRKESPK